MSKYGALVQDLRVKEASARYFQFFFMKRRIIFSSLIAFVKARPWLQIQIIAFLCNNQLIYIGYFEPFMHRWMNRLELANEFLVLASTYFLFIYTDAFMLKHEPLLDDASVVVKDYSV